VCAVKKWLGFLLGASLLAAGLSPLSAADDSPAKGPGREESEKRKENWKKLSPEERETKRKEIMARLEKRISELRTKQTNATITVVETRELTRSEQILKRFEQNVSAASKAERPITNDLPATPVK
jgi:hypothetical protein